MAAKAARLVMLGNDIAGTLVRSSGGDLSFTYDDGYRNSALATPLSVSMPLQIKTHNDAVITPWLWGLLPDNNKVLEAWGRQFTVSISNPFALLATPIGEDCAGAVRIVAEDRVGALTSTLPSADDITWLTEDDIAQRLRDLVQNATSWLGARRTGRFSLAGTQPKTALLLRDGQWGEPHGAAVTTHILKPAVVGFDDHDLNEHLCLAAMRAAGISAVRTRVQWFGDQSAIVVQRYDRQALRDGSSRRIHQEDMAQALGYHPDSKYQNDGGPSVAQISALLRRVMPAEQARADVEGFLSALVWNWIIAGTDAHAKNYSILLSGREVALAPFYDVASALPYPDMSPKKLKMAMKFGTGYKMNPMSAPWEKLAADTGVREVRVREIAENILSQAAEAFDKAAHETHVTALGSALPNRLTNLVEERVVECRKLLAG